MYLGQSEPAEGGAVSSSLCLAVIPPGEAATRGSPHQSAVNIQGCEECLVEGADQPVPSLPVARVGACRQWVGVGLLSHDYWTLGSQAWNPGWCDLEWVSDENTNLGGHVSV